MLPTRRIASRAREGRAAASAAALRLSGVRDA